MYKNFTQTTKQITVVDSTTCNICRMSNTVRPLKINGTGFMCTNCGTQEQCDSNGNLLLSVVGNPQQTVANALVTL